MGDARQYGPGFRSVVCCQVSVVVALWTLSAAVLDVAAAAQSPTPALTPEATVTRYLDALKTGNFSAAYDYLSTGMVEHKSRADWAKEQQWSMQMSDAKIFEFHVYPGKIEGDRAQVPDLLSSQDKFLNQLGLPEHELYTLIREDGRWKIDQQQLLEPSEQRKWFPTPRPEGK